MFEFVSAGRIVFGAGAAHGLQGYLGNFRTSRPFLVVGSRGLEGYQQVLAGIEVTASYKVVQEPTVEDCCACVELARSKRSDSVICIGGGSVMDMGKAVAMLLANGGHPLDYLEVIGAGQPISTPSVPLFAIPTTAGTGSEVTKNAVLDSPEHGRKCSLRSEYMLPSMAIIDPELTYSCPSSVTVYSGLDAFTQCLEPYTSNKFNELTDALALQGMECAIASLSAAVAHANGGGLMSDVGGMGGRHKMCVASVCGGLSLANAKLGAVHGLAGVLGGHLTNAPHGALCAVLLPHCVRANVEAVRALSDTTLREQYLARFARIARLFGHTDGSNEALAQACVASVHDFVVQFQVPTLTYWGLKAEDIPAVAEKSASSSSMKGNPVPLPPNVLEQILHLAM